MKRGALVEYQYKLSTNWLPVHCEISYYSVCKVCAPVAFRSNTNFCLAIKFDTLKQVAL